MIMLMKKFLWLAVLLLTSTIAHAELSLDQEQAFGKELKRLFASEALVPLYTRIGDHEIWMYESVDHLRSAGPTMDFSSQSVTPKICGFYVPYSRYKPFFAFVHDNMQLQSAESKQRIVAHEMMHALDYEVLKVSMSQEFKAEFDKDMNNIKKIQGKATGEQHKTNAKVLQVFAYYLAKPEEAWAEAAARAIFPPSNTKDRDNFEKILKNVVAYARAKLIAEKLVITRPASARK